MGGNKRVLIGMIQFLEDLCMILAWNYLVRYIVVIK